MSFGLALISDGSLTTDQYSLAPASGAAAAAAKVAATPTLGGLASALAPDAGPNLQAKTARKAKKWGKHDRPFLPGGRKLRPGTRVAPAFLADNKVNR
jgi:hypothetical protein